MNKTAITTLLLLFTISCTTSYADIYKYVDKNGVTHYTNMPKNNNYIKIIGDDGRNARIDYEHIISRKSVKYDIRPSKKGAIGLMQLMPTTARDMKISDPYDPEDNIEAGTRYLRYLLNRFDGSLKLALAAYNAGPTRVERSGGIPRISETREYVRRVISGSSYTPETQTYKTSMNNGITLYTNTPAKKYYNPLSNF